MELGAPRISVTELTDLHRLLMDRGFRRSSLDDFRVVQEEHNAEVVRPESDNIGRLAPFLRQLRIVFAPNQLRGMTAPERAKAVAVLSSLLMQAAGRTCLSRPHH